MTKPDADLQFRKATTDDLDSLVQMLADDPLGATREDPCRPTHRAYRDAFAAIERDINQLLAVAEQGGAIVGCMQLSFIPGLSRKGMWRGQIESVRIAKHARGQGIGREMFVWAIDMCRQRGCKLVQLTSDSTRVDALRFYQDLGFEPSHVGLKLSL